MGKRESGGAGVDDGGTGCEKGGVTVRTLQYYDKEGLLSPTAVSEGGRRLYTDKDVVRLHQILSMKSLGFSLDDIKNRLIPLDTPGDVAEVLTNQAAALREKIESLSESLKAIEALREEVLQMHSVDFGKYADIVVNLQMKNEYYWLIKNLDDRALECFRGVLIKKAVRQCWKPSLVCRRRLCAFRTAERLPESEKGLKLAEAYWDMIMEFTDGDMSLIPGLMETENWRIRAENGRISRLLYILLLNRLWRLILQKQDMIRLRGRQMSYAIEIDGLKKSYGNHMVLKGLSFQVARGEIFALLVLTGQGRPLHLSVWKGCGNLRTAVFGEWQNGNTVAVVLSSRANQGDGSCAIIREME